MSINQGKNGLWAPFLFHSKWNVDGPSFVQIATAAAYEFMVTPAMTHPESRFFTFLHSLVLAFALPSFMMFFEP